MCLITVSCGKIEAEPQDTTAEGAVDSAPVQFLQFMWGHIQEGTSHSWLKLNHAMRDALELTVKAGMKFSTDDLSVISRRFRAGYWMGSDSEWFYRLAVLYRNSSAYDAYEAWSGRKAFIFKGASISTHTGDGPCGQGLARLIVGADFKWNGERVRVSSFNDEKGSFTALSYRRDGDPETCKSCRRQISWPADKINKRYTITHADLKAAKKSAKLIATPEPSK